MSTFVHNDLCHLMQEQHFHQKQRSNLVKPTMIPIVPRDQTIPTCKIEHTTRHSHNQFDYPWPETWLFQSCFIFLLLNVCLFLFFCFHSLLYAIFVSQTNLDNWNFDHGVVCISTYPHDNLVVTDYFHSRILLLYSLLCYTLLSKWIQLYIEFNDSNNAISNSLDDLMLLL